MTVRDEIIAIRKQREADAIAEVERLCTELIKANAYLAAVRADIAELTQETNP